MNDQYLKELFTCRCEDAESIAQNILKESSILTLGETDCLKQLIPQLRIAAELFRQCAKLTEYPKKGGK